MATASAHRERLRQASTEELARLKTLCERRDESARPRRPIALVGLRGAGKSTVGATLGEVLELPFFELDSLIEEAAGLSVPDWPTTILRR